MKDIWLYRPPDVSHVLNLMNTESEFESMLFVIDVHFGLACNNSCACVNGDCNPSNGTCSCYPNYFGSSCNNSCSCVNGDCNSNGTCNCFENFVGENCDTRCFDSDCKVNCTCNNSNSCYYNETICSNNLVSFSNNNLSIVSNNSSSNLNNLNVSDSSIFFTGSFNILGNASIENSLLSFSLSETIIKGDLSFSNSSFTFSNSTILVDGCVYLKNNTQLTIDFSKYNIGEQNTKITLIKSLNSCLNKEGDISFTYLNQLKCSSITNNIDSSSISIILNFNACESSNGIKSQYPFYFIEIFIFIITLHQIVL